MVIYYSGTGYSYANPEVLLGDECTLMLTFHDYHKKGEPDKRFRDILKRREFERDARWPDRSRW